MPGRVSIRLNQTGIARITQERVMRAARAVGNESARRVNVDNGYLRSTRSVQNLGRGRALVAYRASYAAAVHDGSRPHAIPNAFGRGADFGTASNFHPGYRGNPYLTSAAGVVMRRLGRR